MRITIILLWVTCCATPAAAQTRFEYSEIAMGVCARIVLYASDRASADSAALDAYKRIAQLEDIMSDYRPGSELMRLCKKAGGPPVQVSPDLYYVLDKCQELARRSDGGFDCTVGPLVKLWRAARKSGTLPDSSDLEDARKLTGWRLLRVPAACDKPGFVQLMRVDMLLDLGGIAKGYACDEALKTLRSRGIKSALIEMGGDIAVGDPPPGKNGWQIDVANAPSPKTVSLKNAAISSSGDVEQYIEIDGKRYSHIVNPKTGLGLTDRIAVTVVAPNATTSDSLSTAISVLGETRGKTLANTFAGVWVYVRRAGG